MKNLLALAFGVMPFFVFSQSVDTVAVVRQVDSLVQFSQAFTDQLDFDKALEVSEAAEKLALEKLGRETATYAKACENHGNVFYWKRDYLESEKWLLRAKEIREKVLGKEHHDYTMGLFKLAILYKDKGNYPESELIYLEAKEIREKALGKENPDYATSLYHLANLYRNKGGYEEAERLHLEAKEIREKALGKETPEYGLSLNSLALVYSDKGEYDKSEPLYWEAKAIFEKTSGKESPCYAQTLNNLAILYRVMGNNEKARPLYIEAKDIREKTKGKESPDYAQSLNSLANLYRVMGNYEKARPLYIEAKGIREKILGKENPSYAQTLSNLAVLYHCTGEYGKAGPLFFEAKAIWEKALGKEHPDFAESLSNLGTLYRAIGNFEQAGLFHLEARAIREKVLGKEHPDYAGSLNNLALVFWDKGDWAKAAPYFLSSNTATKSLLQKSAAYSSEREMLHYQALFERRFDDLLHFAQTYPTDSVIFAAYDNALFLNSALLFNAASLERGIAHADNSTQAIHAEWKSCHFQLAKKYALPIAERDPASVAHLEERANEFERELVRRSPAFVESQQVVSWREVCDRLRPGEAAIEFVHYRYHDRNPTDTTMYAALVLLPGGESPHWVPLFEEKQLTALLENQQADKEGSINQLYGSPALYDLVWKPLEKWLGGVERIYYSPSGLLHRLSPEAISLSSGGVLTERYEFHRIISTRQLVTGSPASDFVAGDAVVYGGLRYDMDSLAMAKANEAWSFEETASPSKYGLATYGNLRGGGHAWNYLPWTEIEAKGVAKLLKGAGAQVEVRQGYAATEESFAALGKKSPAPKVLHLATHAFFFPDPKIRDDGRPDSYRERADEPVFKMSEHPMMRSGLLLAGANHTWSGGRPPKGMEDGILTAYEISQMNLSGTELAVLSACETGLGDIEGNEGVYGLQRAFKIAGAKYLIMSLWQVPDYQTEELMTAFYTEWLEGKKTIPEAFRSAQGQVREQHPEPFYWAGFVLVE